MCPQFSKIDAIPANRPRTASRITIACDECGQSLVRTVARIKKDERDGCIYHFCDSDCFHKFQRRPVEVQCVECKIPVQTTQHYTRLKKPILCEICSERLTHVSKITTNCSWCGTELRYYRGRLEGHENHYCNKTCFDAHQISTRVTVQCTICGTDMVLKPSVAERGNANVCSEECRREHLRRSVIKRWDSSETRVYMCDFCGKEFTRKPNQLKKYKTSFCSRDCHYKAMNHGNGEYAPGWTQALKDRVHERDNYKCRFCNITEAEQGEALQVHHLDGKRTCHDMKNLALLCRQCHVRLHSGFITWLQLSSKIT